MDAGSIHGKFGGWSFDLYNALVALELQDILLQVLSYKLWSSEPDRSTRTK
jgi:hypothetical protein